MTSEEMKKFNEERIQLGKSPLLYPGDPEWEATYYLKSTHEPASLNQPPPPAPAIPEASPSPEQTRKAAEEAARSKKPEQE